MKEIVKCIAVIAIGVATCLAIMADAALAIFCIPIGGIAMFFISR